MTQQLPTPGQDDGTWGYMLNGFLNVAHNPDGTLQTLAQTPNGANAVAVGGGLLAANNLSDLASATTAQTNLGLGSAATQNSSAFDPAGAASTVQAASLQKTNNLSDVADAGTSRANIHVPVLTPAACVVTSNVSSLSGLNTYDGYQTVAGDLILLTGQSTASQNGLWVAASGSWTRPSEMASGLSMKARTVAVIQGTSYSGTTWLLKTNSSLTIDTSSQSWIQQFPTSSLVSSTSASANKVPVANGSGGYSWEGVGRTVISVAASNTPAALTAGADYVCTGTNDDVVINSAITALTSGGGSGGGIIQLLPGSFNLGTTSASFINLGSGNSGALTLRGAPGNSSSIIIPATTAAPQAILASSWKSPAGSMYVENLEIYGTSPYSSVVHGIWMQCSQGAIRNCVFSHVPGNGIILDGAPTSSGGSPSAATYNCIVEGCYANFCGSNILNSGGTPGIAYQVTSLSQNATFIGCYVDGGSSNSASLITTTVSSGVATSSIAVAGGTWEALTAGQRLLLVSGTAQTGGYQELIVSSNTSAGATSIPVNSFTPSTSFYGSQAIVLDPTVCITQTGFYISSMTHLDHCHPYFCWRGLFSYESAVSVIGGEYETNASFNIVLILGSDPYSLGVPNTPVIVEGIFMYGNPQCANIYVYGVTSMASIVGNNISGGKSLYGIWISGTREAVVSGNVVLDAVSPSNNSVGIYLNGVDSATITANTVGISSAAGTPSPSHKGISINNTTNSLIMNNSLYRSVGSGTSAFGSSGTNTGTVVRNNVGYNPLGTQTVSVPSSGSPTTAAIFDQTFYVTANASGTTTVAISSGPTITVPASACVSVKVPAGQTLTPTYTNAPTWVVEGE